MTDPLRNDTVKAVLLLDCCTGISHFSSTSLSDNEPRYNAQMKVTRRQTTQNISVIMHSLPSGVAIENAVGCRCTPRFFEFQVRTAEVSQIVANYADPSPHKYLNPHIPKAQLAVTLKHGISDNKERACLHCKHFIKPTYKFITTTIILPGRNDNMIKMS